MAWTTPRTWATNEVPTASIMNTHVRDNFNASEAAAASSGINYLWSTAANALTFVGIGTYKTADETVNGSTTLQDDDHLFFTVNANEVWRIDYVLYGSNASLNPGFKANFSIPSGATWHAISRAFFSTDTTDGNETGSAPQDFSFAGGDFIETAITTWVRMFAVLEVTLINGANAGSFKLQWAQAASKVSDTKLLKGSYMMRTRMA